MIKITPKRPSPIHQAHIHLLSKPDWMVPFSWEMSKDFCRSSQATTNSRPPPSWMDLLNYFTLRSHMHDFSLQPRVLSFSWCLSFFFLTHLISVTAFFSSPSCTFVSPSLFQSVFASDTFALTSFVSQAKATVDCIRIDPGRYVMASHPSAR